MYDSDRPLVQGVENGFQKGLSMIQGRAPQRTPARPQLK